MGTLCMLHAPATLSWMAVEVEAKVWMVMYVNIAFFLEASSLNLTASSYYICYDDAGEIIQPLLAGFDDTITVVSFLKATLSISSMVVQHMLPSYGGSFPFCPFFEREREREEVDSVVGVTWLTFQ